MTDTGTAVVDGLEKLGFPALVSRVVDDARDVASAEVAVYKARIGERVGAYKGAVVFFVLAGILALEAIGALLVGLILTLATLVGPGFATLIVVGVVLAICGVLAGVGKARLAPAPGDPR